MLLLSVPVVLLATSPIVNDYRDCYFITKINIQIYDVAREPGVRRKDQKFVYRTLQALHYKTQESVVRKALFFKRGDCYDAELVADNARSLRNFDIFSDADILVKKEEENKTVELTVITYDRYTLRGGFSYSRQGGLNKSQFSFGESNLLGLNKRLQYTTFSRSDGKANKKIVYNDPQLFRYFNLENVYNNSEDGESYFINFRKPFWNFNDQNAYQWFYQRDKAVSEFNNDLSGNQDENTTKIKNNIKQFLFSWSHEFGTRDLSRRLILNSQYQRQSFGIAPADIFVPKPLKKYSIKIGYQWIDRHEYQIRHSINNMIRKEDILLHNTYEIGAGMERRDHEDENHHDHLLLYGNLSGVKAIGLAHLFSWQALVNSRLYKEKRQSTKVNSFFHHYWFFAAKQSLVAGLAYDYRYVADDLYIPLTLGGDNGLRGYDAFSFTGNKRLLINLEHRLKFNIKSNKHAIGQVIFIDGGMIKQPGHKMDFEGMRWSIGWGIRADIPYLFGKNIIRIDLARTLDGGDNSLSLSISKGQLFSHDEPAKAESREF